MQQISLEIDADPGQLQQVFLNLVLNGIDAIAEKGTITIKTARTSDEFVQIQISDTGKGIAPEALGNGIQSILHNQVKGKRIWGWRSANALSSSTTAPSMSSIIRKVERLCHYAAGETENRGICTMKIKGRIFLLDDDELIVTMLSRALRNEGFETQVQTSSQDINRKNRGLAS